MDVRQYCMQVPYVYVLNYVLYNARCRFVAIIPRFPSHWQWEALAEHLAAASPDRGSYTAGGTSVLRLSCPSGVQS